MMALAFLAHREKENTEVPSLHQLALAWALLGLVATAGINPRGSLLLRRDRCVVVVNSRICGHPPHLRLKIFCIHCDRVPHGDNSG
jgi:hypothetical protein